MKVKVDMISNCIMLHNESTEFWNAYSTTRIVGSWWTWWELYIDGTLHSIKSIIPFINPLQIYFNSDVLFYIDTWINWTLNYSFITLLQVQVSIFICMIKKLYVFLISIGCVSTMINCVEFKWKIQVWNWFMIYYEGISKSIMTLVRKHVYSYSCRLLMALQPKQVMRK